MTVWAHVSAMTPAGDDQLDIDEIDRKIIEILASDPRRPYADITEKLAADGIEMSSEGVRRRVRKLLDHMTSFFLPRPEGYDWEIFLVTVRACDEPDAKRQAFEAVSAMDFWFVAEGVGTVDIYAIATAESVDDIDDLLVEVRSLESVAAVDHFIETDRTVNIEKYLLVY
jgi:DNA-binding Lrp family transcriptional regulator